MRVLVIGKSGQLARCIADACYDRQDLHVTMIGRSNLSDLAQWLHPPKEPPMDAVINTAAFTDIPACEMDFDTAFRVNAIGIANLLAGMPEECHLYHLSTDYVFDGLQAAVALFGNQRVSPPQCDPSIPPYRVHQRTLPINNYGRTKRAGELIAFASDRATVIRTASLFSKYGSTGKGGSNFLLGMLKRATEEARIVTQHSYQIGPLGTLLHDDKAIIEPILVDSDVMMSPTYTPWLARAILELVAREAKPSIAHIVCEGPPVSWYEFAKAIFEVGGFTDALKRLMPKKSDDWPPRPKFSALENSESYLGMGTWREALEEFFANEWPKMEAGLR